MSRWFRVYDDLVDDPKVQRLPDALFKALVNLWCLASNNGGRLPPIADICFKLRIKPEKGAALIAGLKNVGLIDEDEAGFAPHNWNARQFKSDVSNERVKRHRERKCNVTDAVTVTPPETEQIQNRADSEKKDIRAVEATRPDPFEEFWKAYPKRDGANPKAPARKKFLAAVKSGVPAETIIAAAKRSAEEARSKGQIGTPYVPQAMTWLNQQRWGDYQQPAEDAQGPPQPPSPDLPTDEELRRKYQQESNGRDHHRSTPPEPETGVGQHSGDEGKLLAERPAGDRGGGRVGGSHRPRVPGIRSLGDVLREAPGLGTLGAQGGEDGDHRSNDDAGTVAGVVRH